MENDIAIQILSELRDLKQSVARLEERQVKFEERQVKFEEDQANFARELQDVKERVILIENEHGKDLKALHDGYRLLYGIAQETRDDVRRLHEHNVRQDARIMVLSGEA